MDCRNLDRHELAERYLTGQLQAEPDVSREDFSALEAGITDPSSGSLATISEKDFEVHLLECAKCREALDLLQVLRDELAKRGEKIPTKKPPSDSAGS